MFFSFFCVLPNVAVTKSLLHYILSQHNKIIIYSLYQPKTANWFSIEKAQKTWNWNKSLSSWTNIDFNIWYSFTFNKTVDVIYSVGEWKTQSKCFLWKLGNKNGRKATNKCCMFFFQSLIKEDKRKTLWLFLYLEFSWKTFNPTCFNLLEVQSLNIY